MTYISCLSPNQSENFDFRHRCSHDGQRAIPQAQVEDCEHWLRGFWGIFYSPNNQDLSFHYQDYPTLAVFLGTPRNKLPKNRFQQEHVRTSPPHKLSNNPKKNCLVQKPGITLGVSRSSQVLKCQIIPQTSLHPTLSPSRPPCYHPASRNIEPRWWDLPPGKLKQRTFESVSPVNFFDLYHHPMWICVYIYIQSIYTVYIC